MAADRPVPDEPRSDRAPSDRPLSDRGARRIAGLRHRRGRAKHGQFLVEGIRSVEEALRAAWSLGEVLADRGALDARGRAAWDEAAGRGIPCVDVPADVLAGLASTTTPQPVLATAARPDGDLASALDETTGPVLVVDGVQDPGNAGGLIRVAHAFGAGAVVFLEGAADPFNPKAVRGSMGSIFHVALARDVAAAALREALASRGMPLVAAVAREGEDGADLGRARAAFAVGSEGAGLSPAVLDAATHRVTLHLPGSAESLNVVAATAVLLDRHTR